MSSPGESLGPRRCCSAATPCGTRTCSLTPSLPTAHEHSPGAGVPRGFLAVEGAPSAVGRVCHCGSEGSGEGATAEPPGRGVREAQECALLGWPPLHMGLVLLWSRSSPLEPAVCPALPPGPAFAATSSSACSAQARTCSQPGQPTCAGALHSTCLPLSAMAPGAGLVKHEPGFWLCSVGLVPLCCIQCCH